MCKSTHFGIYIRKPHVFLPLLATTEAASMPQYRLFLIGFSHKSQFFSRENKEAKICNGKYKGLAIVYAKKRLLDLFYKAFAPQNA